MGIRRGAGMESQLACPIFCCLLLKAASNSLIFGAAGEGEAPGDVIDVNRVPTIKKR